MPSRRCCSCTMRKSPLGSLSTHASTATLLPTAFSSGPNIFVPAKGPTIHLSCSRPSFLYSIPNISSNSCNQKLNFKASLQRDQLSYLCAVLRHLEVLVKVFDIAAVYHTIGKLSYLFAL